VIFLCVLAVLYIMDSEERVIRIRTENDDLEEIYYEQVYIRDT